MCIRDRVEPVLSPTGEIESFRPVTIGDSDLLEELTGVTVMSNEEIEETNETNPTEDTNGPDDYLDGPTRPSSSIPQIANETGLTPQEVKSRIEEHKQQNLPTGTNVTNPDVVVDLDTGEIYPQAPGGTYGDSIGNIYDQP